MKLLVGVTGANGFIGKRLCDQLSISGYLVRKIVRSNNSDEISQIAVGDITESTNWSSALDGVDTIIHCAAHVHDLNSRKESLSQQFKKVNCEGTIELAKQCVKAGVRRLIFLSSIKVNGEATALGFPFNYTSIPLPEDSYGRSKLEAERVLTQIGNDTGLEIIIIRSPLVYGPFVKANFLSLMDLVASGRFLPFKAIKNKRSFVSIDNLCSLIIHCVEHTRAIGQTFLVSDGSDLSTPELITMLSKSMGKRSNLIWVPNTLLQVAGRMTGTKDKIHRLTSSLQINIDHTSQTLNWKPPKSVDQSIQLTVQWYMKQKVMAKHD